MGGTSAAIVAAEGGQQNFLIPNGTVFVVLVIFLIVLGVIAKWVVPPITKVLGEREAMVQATNENTREAASQFAAADADYEKAMAAARKQAGGIRDGARAEGRKILEDMRARATEESAASQQQASEQLKEQGEAISAELRSSVDTLATTLATRVLGVEPGKKPAPRKRAPRKRTTSTTSGR